MPYLKNGALVALAFVALPAAQAFAADGGTYATLHAGEPAIADGQGRVYFYRGNGLMGVAIQPSIYIDGENSGGRSKPGDYFYVDLAAGSHQISTTTEKKEALDVAVSAGQPVYVKFEMSMGFFAGHLSPTLKDAGVAASEIKDCDWYERKPVAAKPAPAKAADDAGEQKN